MLELSTAAKNDVQWHRVGGGGHYTTSFLREVEWVQGLRSQVKLMWCPGSFREPIKGCHNILKYKPPSLFMLKGWSTVLIAWLTVRSVYRILVARIEESWNGMRCPRSILRWATTDSSGCSCRMWRWCSLNLISTDGLSAQCRFCRIHRKSCRHVVLLVLGCLWQDKLVFTAGPYKGSSAAARSSGLCCEAGYNRPKWGRHGCANKYRSVMMAY
jgi:hypothetical protein